LLAEQRKKQLLVSRVTAGTTPAIAVTKYTLNGDIILILLKLNIQLEELLAIAALGSPCGVTHHAVFHLKKHLKLLILHLALLSSPSAFIQTWDWL
jgi:hypothetical protein